MSTLLASGHVLIGAKVGPALAGMAQVQKKFMATGARMGRTGMALSKAVSLPIVAGFAASIKAAADFESSLNNMQAVSGATDREMAKVGETAKQLGADAKLPATSAKDAADAMVELAKGGMNAQQAMEAARGTIMLSAAAGVSNARAAEIQSDALNSFGLKASEAGRVADLLAASANATTAEITDMASSLQQSSAVAHQAGFSIEETTVALSMMANAGIKGSDAGTSLKTMLMRLQAPIGRGAKMINELGLELRDAGGELKSLPELADEFRRKTEGMTKAQKDAAMAAIFGTDAIRAGNVLLSKSGAEYAALTAKITAQGAAQELAEAKMKGFNGALEKFKSSVETAAISIGQILLPMATSFIQRITGLADKFEDLTPAQQRFVIQMAAMAAAVGPALVILGKLGTLLGVLGNSSTAAGMGFARMAGPIGVAVGALVLMAATNEDVRASLSSLGSAVAPVARALAKLAINPVTLGMVAAVAGVLGLVRALTAAKAAMIALTAAARANPIMLFATAAAAVTGALVGLISSGGSAAVSMRDVANAVDQAKAALDRFKGASLSVEQAQLQQRAAVLEVKAANQGLRQTQEQVNSGQIKGKAASLALEQAQLRVKQAQLGVRQSSQQVKTALDQETTERKKSVDWYSKALEKQHARVNAAKQEVALTHGSAESIQKLAKEEATLDRIQRQAAGASKELASKVSSAGTQASSASSKVADLNAQMRNVRSRTANIKVNTADAMMQVVRLVGLMAQIVSKTVTVTIVANHKEGSWTAQRTIEEVDKHAKKPNTLKVEFEAKGTAGVQRSMDRVAKGTKLKITRAVREAIDSARGNAQSLGQSLAGSIAAGLDALLERNVAALGNSPEAQRMRQIDAQLRASQTARERARLQEAIATAETDAERRAAIQDLHEWELDQERQALADQLAAREQQLRDESEARKTAAERGIADLVDSLNRGLITQQQFNEQLKAILAASGVEYGMLGDLLGSAFANKFRDQIDALFQQIRLLSQFAGVPFGFGDIGVEDPFLVQLKEWTNRRKTLAKNLEQARKNAKKKDGPGGTKITADESRLIATREKALRDWDAMKPRRAALGGILRGAGVTDSIPLLAKPGEGVLSHRGMDQLMDMAMGNAGRRGDTTIVVNVNAGNVIGAGSEKELARELARIVRPEIDRRVTVRA